MHTSLFPPFQGSTIEFSFLLNSCLDIFEIRQKQTSVDQDLGLLHAVDERLAVYGWLTTTGVKILVVIDFLGHSVSANSEDSKSYTGANMKDSDLKPVGFCGPLIALSRCGEEHTFLCAMKLRMRQRRLFGRCRQHIFNSYKTPFTPQRTMPPQPKLDRGLSRCALQTRSLLQK